MTSAIRVIIMLALLLGLHACGGSGGSDSPTTPPVQSDWDQMRWDNGEWA